MVQLTAVVWLRLYFGLEWCLSGFVNTTITLDGDKAVTATFIQNSYSLTMYTVGKGAVVPGNGLLLLVLSSILKR